eukprot:510015-Pelagomonas_calceolata.AAC.2
MPRVMLIASPPQRAQNLRQLVTLVIENTLCHTQLAQTWKPPASILRKALRETLPRRVSTTSVSPCCSLILVGVTCTCTANVPF